MNNEDIAYKMEVLGHLIQSAYIMSSDPDGKYYMWCDYSGHVDMVHIRVSSREDDTALFSERAWLDSEDWEEQLKTLARAVLVYIEEDLNEYLG